MPLYKIIKMFLLPPGIFIVIFVLLAIYLAVCASTSRRASDQRSSGLCWALRIASCLCLAFALGSYAISIDAVAGRMLHHLEYMYPSSSIKGDAIIVLGGPSDTRDKHGEYLQKLYQCDIIVSGYRGEAQRMKKHLTANRVPEERIILEPLATNTSDHVRYVLPIVKEKDYKTVILVTDAYHMPRSMLNFERPFKEQGIEVVPSPCGHLTGERRIVDPEREWIPDIRNLNAAALAWHEYLGMLEVWLKQW